MKHSLLFYYTILNSAVVFLVSILITFFSLLCPQIQRGIAYEKTTKEVSSWQNIIAQNQKAEQIVFPLNQESSGPKRVEQVVAGWKVGICIYNLFLIFWNGSNLSWIGLV